MLDPTALLKTPFAQQLLAVRTATENLLAIYLNQNVMQQLPFSGTTVLPPLAASAPTVATLNAEIALGLSALQAAIGVVVPPNIPVGGIGTPVGGGPGGIGGVTP